MSGFALLIKRGCVCVLYGTSLYVYEERQNVDVFYFFVWKFYNLIWVNFFFFFFGEGSKCYGEMILVIIEKK